MGKEQVSLTGQVIGTWLVGNYLGDSKYYCKCIKCGFEKSIRAYDLRKYNGYTCGNCKKNIKQPIDIKGKTFGEWEVIKYLGDGQWECRCSCGVTKSVYGSYLRNGRSTSCGHSALSFVNGTLVGEWTIKGYNTLTGKYICECSCGTVRELSTYQLVNKKSLSCGHGTTGLKDLTGMTFGEWYVIGRSKSLKKTSSTLWTCECSCGKIKDVTSYQLRTGKSKSCGHSTTGFKDIAGETFGDWKAVRYKGNGMWECQCSCGTIRDVSRSHLVNKLTRSCGCKHAENVTKTLLDKYGVYNSAQLHMTPDQAAMSNNKELLLNSIIAAFGDNKPTPHQLTQLLGVGKSQVMVIMRRHNLEHLVSLYESTSKYEDELNTLYPCNNRHDRTLLHGKELDLYYPDIKLAIEFNGDYWHSDINKPQYYHRDKSIIAGKQGIQIIHIFEHEWNDESTKAKLLNLLDRKFGKSNIRRIHGRNCDIREISNSVAVDFCNKYHLQNGINSQINLGCFLDTELLGVMTFRTPRFNGETEYEITRLCWKAGVLVNGGAEKLFKHFISKYNPADIVSYSDLSKFNGKIYQQLGFKFTGLTDPNYKWINLDGDILSRYQTQKRKLVEKGWGTAEQTENEIMESLGYMKVYDCGNLKFIWTRDDKETEVV